MEKINDTGFSDGIPAGNCDFRTTADIRREILSVSQRLDASYKQFREQLADAQYQANEAMKFFKSKD